MIYNAPMKTILTILITLLCLVFASESQAAYDTGNQRASASVEQHLYLTILPALETIDVGETTTETQTEITKTKTIGVRSNTSWQLIAQPYSYGFVNAPYCAVDGAIGLSNGEAGVGNGMQFITVSCVQPRSWGDSDNVSFDIFATASPDVSL